MTGWLAESRKQAESQFRETALPSRKDENYRSTSLKDVMPGDRAAKTVSVTTPLPERLTTLAQGESKIITHRSGEASTMSSLDAFREALDLPHAFKNDLFALQAAAHWSGGVFIHVPKNTKIEGVIRGVHWFDEKSESFFHRTIILAEEGSEITYVDEFCGDETGATPYANGLVRVIARPGATVRYSQIQNWSPATQFFLRQSFEADRDARIEVTSVHFGGVKGQIRTEAVCLAPGAHVDVQGAARGENKQHLDFWVTNRHIAPDTSSEMIYRTVMADQARAVFNGNIIITPEAVRTDASQRNKNLLLSSRAEIDTYPKLEIATDEVKCAHGATVSTIDPQQIYYLASRGIPRHEAETLIINGFTLPVIERLPSEALRAWATSLVERKHSI